MECTIETKCTEAKQDTDRLGNYVSQRKAMWKGHPEFQPGSIADLLYNEDSTRVNGLRVNETSYQLESTRSSTGLLRPVSYEILRY